MSSEEFFKTEEKMKRKLYTDLSELNKDLQITFRKIDGIVPLTNSSDVKEIREYKQPCQDLVFLETDGKKYAMLISSKPTAGWYH